MKRIPLLLLIVMTVLLLTGCGAEVNSTVKFTKEGSGTRTVAAVIKSKDAKLLNGNFERLDKLLEEAAPEGVNLSRTMQGNGDAYYQFSFSFDNIEDYNEKVSQITGTTHNATWYTSDSIFKSNIMFEEEDCTYSLVKWALNAFKRSEYASFQSKFSIYEGGKSKYYLEDVLMYEGEGNPYFTMKIAPALEQIKMFTSYDKEQKFEKKLELSFAENSLENINVDRAKELLNQFSPYYKIDLGNSIITFSFVRYEDFLDFVKNIDKNFDSNSFEYNTVVTPFTNNFKVEENYSLKNFFELFDVSYPYIYDYIKVPSDLDYDEIYHLDELKEDEVMKEYSDYNYFGAYHMNHDYKMGFAATKSASISDVDVSYEFEDDELGVRTITLLLHKDGLQFTRNQLLAYYEDKSDTISYSEDGDKVTISFKKKIKFGQVEDDYSFDKSTRINLKDIRYQFASKVNLTDYIPVDCNQYPSSYQYSIELPLKSSVSKVSIGDKTLYRKNSVFQNRDLLELSQNKEVYSIQGTNPLNQSLEIEIQFTRMSKYYYLMLVFIVFIIIVAGFSIYFYRMKKDKQKGA